MSRCMAIKWGIVFLIGALVAGQAPAQTKVYSSVNPAAGSLISNARPTISAEYVDDGIGVNPNESRLYVDGQDVTSASQPGPNRITYVPSSPLSDGTHTVKLTVVDKAGNTSSASWSFTVDTLPPAVKITSHKAGSFVNRSPVLITGTVDDIRARVMVNGIAAAVEKGTFSARVNIVEGNNTITAVATDPFGNTGNDSITITLDSRPPVVEIISPAPNSVLNTRVVTVNGTIDKNAATVSVGVKGSENHVQAEIGSSTFTARDVKLSEGVNVIFARAVSAAGNAGTATVKVTVDSIPPKIAITSPKNNVVTNKKMITVTGTVDDQGALVKVNNTPAQVTKGFFTLSALSLSEGSNTITVTAVDRAGNEAKAASVIVVLDTTPPSSPTLDTLTPVTRTPHITITGSSEPGAAVEIFVNNGSRGTVRADDKGGFSLKVGLSEGNNTITAIAYDASGNASAPSAPLNVFLDTKPPKIL